ncbi:substrate-binding periplasmic protein [Sneathiella limimaris]|uniref:substrate-binding periplasmic protein n=1 Tax=Sneathiella limimaris TaxID=1964213 RepID=UPI00146B4246|nr:transporter substrate-binding domain-containing protein [Sneathiella limimaris]
MNSPEYKTGRLWIGIAFVLVLLIKSAFAQAEGKTLNVVTYYDYPPFVTDKNQGLFFNFIEELKELAGPDYQINSQVLPRKRLNELLQEGRSIIVPFIHWSFFQDPEQDRYIWTPAFAVEKNLILSHTNNPVLYRGEAQNLTGLKFASVRGHVYVELQQAIDEGKIRNIITNSQISCLKLLLNQRVDFTTLPSSTLQFYLRKLNAKEEIHIATVPRTVFGRHVMMTKNLVGQRELLNQVVEKIKDSKEWQKNLIFNGLEPVE